MEKTFLNMNEKYYASLTTEKKVFMFRTSIRARRTKNTYFWFYFSPSWVYFYPAHTEIMKRDPSFLRHNNSPPPPPSPLLGIFSFPLIKEFYFYLPGFIVDTIYRVYLYFCSIHFLYSVHSAF
jgi:hypothetical protein